MTTATAICGTAHHWSIAAPDPVNGGRLPARCKKCGAEKEFRPDAGENPEWNFGTTIRKTDRAKKLAVGAIICPQCNRAFLSHRGLTQHEKWGDCDREKTHQCICGQRFQTPASLRYHGLHSAHPEQHREVA